MKKTRLILLLLIILLNCGWRSETGTEVVSDLEVIVRTSLEATQVLQSDALGLLYGENRLGGAVNYSSFDSGGTLSMKNVVSSIDVVKMKNNQMMSWVTTTGVTRRFGVSTDNRFVIRASIDAEGYNISADRVKVTSVDSNQYAISGTPGRASSYSVNSGSCTVTFTGGLLTGSSC